MAVYVDDFRAKYRGMLMYHMIADTEEELEDMARRIGVALRHKQRPIGDRPAHFDICQTKRRLAVKHGAIEITRKELVRRFPRRGKL